MQRQRCGAGSGHRYQRSPVIANRNVASVGPRWRAVLCDRHHFEGLAGDDTFNVLPAASGTVLNIDGGAPTFNPLSVDRVVIDAPANPANQVSIQAGATSDSGSIIANLAGVLRAPINFSRVEGITVNNSGAAGLSVTMAITRSPWRYWCQCIYRYSRWWTNSAVQCGY